MKNKIIIIALALLALAMSGCGMNANPGTNEKVGTIISIHRVGLINDTWEAQLVRGGFNNGSGVMGTSFFFTVEYAGQVDQLKKYMESGEEVKITYRTEAVYSFMRSASHGNFLTEVQSLHH